MDQPVGVLLRRSRFESGRGYQLVTTVSHNVHTIRSTADEAVLWHFVHGGHYDLHKYVQAIFTTNDNILKHNPFISKGTKSKGTMLVSIWDSNQTIVCLEVGVN